MKGWYKGPMDYDMMYMGPMGPMGPMPMPMMGPMFFGKGYMDYGDLAAASVWNANTAEQLLSSFRLHLTYLGKGPMDGFKGFGKGYVAPKEAKGLVRSIVSSQAGVGEEARVKSWFEGHLTKLHLLANQNLCLPPPPFLVKVGGPGNWWQVE